MRKTGTHTWAACSRYLAGILVFCAAALSQAGIIGGTVLLPDHSPAANVTVELFSDAGATTAALSTKTGMAGTFNLSGIADSFFWIRLSASGFPQQWYSPWGSTLLAGFAQSSTIPGSDSIMIILSTAPYDNTPTAALAMNFVDTSGTMVQSVTMVEIMNQRTGFLTTHYPQSTGELQLTAMEPGEYIIALNATGYPRQYYTAGANTYSGGEIVSLYANQTTAITVTMVKQFSGTGRLSGIVRGADNQPMAGVYLSLFAAFDLTLPAYNDISGPDGSFSFINLADYGYMLSIPASGDYPGQWFNPSGNTVVPTWTILPMSSALMTGDTLLVTLSRAPVDNTPSASIRMIFVDSLGKPVGDIQSISLNSTTTGQTYSGQLDSANTSSIYAVTGGTYSIQITSLSYPNQYYHPNGNTTAASYPVQIQPDSMVIVKITMTMQPGGNGTTDPYTSWVRGTVSSSAGPLGGAIITLVAPAGDPVATGVSDQTGSYLVGPAPALAHALRIEAPGYPIQYYNPGGNTSSIINTSLFMNTAFDTIRIDVMMTATPADSTITTDTVPVALKGIVRGLPDSKGLDAVTIRAFDATTPITALRIPEDLRGGYTTRSAGDGQFTLMVPAGRSYYLFASSDSANWRFQFYNQADDAGQAVAVTAPTTSQPVAFDFLLRYGAIIQGSAVDDAGKPVIGAGMTLKQVNGMYCFTTVTNSAGAYVFRGVPAASYEIQAHHDSYAPLATEPSLRTVIAAEGQSQTVAPMVLVQGGRLQITSATRLTQSGDSGSGYAIFLFDQSTQTVLTPVHYASGYALDTSRIITDIAPVGSWRAIVSPYPRMISGQWSGETILSGPGYAYAGPAATLRTARLFTVNVGDTAALDASIPAGYSIFGSVNAETIITTGQSWYCHIGVFTREEDRHVMVAHGYTFDDTRFEIPGMIDKCDYWVSIDVSGYPRQWWSPASGYTAAPQQPWKFDAATYQALDLRPEKTIVIDTIGPVVTTSLPAIQSMAVTPVGLQAIRINWKPLTATYPVSGYRVMRIIDPPSTLFTTEQTTSGSRTWTPVSKDSLDRLMVRFETRDTVFVDTQVTPGQRYLYVVAAMDTAGNDGTIFLSADRSIESYKVGTSYGSFIQQTTLAAQQWHLVSVCGLDSLAAHPQSAVKAVYAWDDTRQEDRLLTRYISSPRLHRGGGYWVFGDSAVTLSCTPASFDSLVRHRSVQTIRLAKGATGWNLVGSPFPYPVAPDWLSSGFSAFEWDPATNQYIPATRLLPWRGYWIFNPGNRDTILPVPLTPPSAATTVLTRAAARQTIWEVQISLQASASMDSYNYIGVGAPALARTPHLLTTPEPPAPMEYPQLYLVDSSATRQSRLLYCAQPASRADLHWTVALSASDEAVTIRCSDLEKLPQGLTLHWIDQNGAHDLQATDSVVIPPHAVTSFAQIVATHNPARLALYGTQALLHPGYPNPFTASTTIRFTLPYRWTAQGTLDQAARPLQVAIFDMSGRRITNLIDGHLTPGDYTLHWSGCSQQGRLMASGMYLVRLQADTQHAARKLFLMR